MLQFGIVATVADNHEAYSVLYPCYGVTTQEQWNCKKTGTIPSQFYWEQCNIIGCLNSLLNGLYICINYDTNNRHVKYTSALTTVWHALMIDFILEHLSEPKVSSACFAINAFYLITFYSYKKI